MSALVKVALVREAGVQVGIPARMFFRCPCGARPEVPEETIITDCSCGRSYDTEGYLAKSEARS